MYYRASPGSFLRRLLEKGGLFTLEEIASSSVQGKPSSHGSTRNLLDPVKFKAAKGEYKSVSRSWWKHMLIMKAKN